jgi:hypothetical protein
MTEFPFDFRLREVEPIPGVKFNVTRPFLRASPPTLKNFNFACFFDTGAPISVVSFGMLHYITWKRLARHQDLSPEYAFWHGLPCDLGETTIHLTNQRTNTTSKTCRVFGKFVLQPASFEKDRFMILGMNFLIDNEAKASMSGVSWNCVGQISINEI